MILLQHGVAFRLDEDVDELTLGDDTREDEVMDDDLDEALASELDYEEMEDADELDIPEMDDKDLF